MRVPSVPRAIFGRPVGGTCAEGYAACAWPGLNEIWVQPGSWLAQEALYHELGHLYDAAHMTNRDREAAERIMGEVGKHWDEAYPRDPQGGASDDFADGYAFCAEARGRPGWREASFEPFRPQTVGQFCSLIVRVRSQVGSGAPFTAATP